MRVEKDKVVSVEYTLTDSKGTVLDTSKGHEPLDYLHGVGGIVPGLEAALDGKSVGEEIKVTIPPEQAYGPRDENLVQDVPRKAFGESKVEPGMQFQAEGKNAGSRVVSVVSVADQSIRIDANHPLAGKTLHFDVKIVSIRDASQEEIDHKHVHGPGGHHHH